MRKRGVFMAKGSYRLTGAHQERRGLNWCGQPIQEGEGYGGREENIPAQWSEKLVKAAAKQHQHYCVVTENDVAEVFGNGAYKLPRSEAAKLLEARTGVHRTSCYRALRPKGRFARHLYANGTMLAWR
jgi:hypothetical protein